MDQSVLAADKKPLTKEESAKVIEAAIRKAAGSPTGEFTKADLEKVTKLDLRLEKLTDVKGLEKLTQLTVLNLRGNPDLTKAQIAELQKALPKCRILSNPTK
jgi:Leucine-rich repeat (LRR) protein